MEKYENGAKMEVKMGPKSMQNRALGAPGLSFCGFGRILEEADFSCFFDRQKVGQKSEKSGMLAAKGKVSGILGRVCGRGVAHGEVRRGQALRSRRMLPEFPENMRTRRFLWGGWGKENLEELGELEFGELEEGAWILRRRTRVAV
jgi:hypothetical protein